MLILDVMEEIDSYWARMAADKRRVTQDCCGHSLVLELVCWDNSKVGLVDDHRSEAMGCCTY